MSVDPQAQKEMAIGTPVKFTYYHEELVGGSAVGGQKEAVGKVHSRQADGTYTIDLMNGGRKNQIADAQQWSEELLKQEWNSEHGMITHKDAMKEYHTDNAVDSIAQRRMSVDPQAQKEMAIGTPVKFTYYHEELVGGSAVG